MSGFIVSRGGIQSVGGQNTGLLLLDTLCILTCFVSFILPAAGIGAGALVRITVVKIARQ
jgi:hypothetical protein